jgi:LuxR family transcriptional regulator, quorum-sensing system regulator SdiA
MTESSAYHYLTADSKVVSPRSAVDPDFAAALGFVAQVDQAKCYQESVDILHSVLQSIGFHQLVYGRTDVARRADGKWNPIPLTTRMLPPGWDRDWARHSINDPHLHLACERGTVDWVQARESYDLLSSVEMDALSYISDIGLRNGLTILFKGRRRFSFVTVHADPQPDDQWRNLLARTTPILKLHTSYFDHVIAARFDSSADASMPVLSQRELECLTWSARGKTVEEIAKIIGISPETVRVYFKRANQKLGALNRSHAVARAASLGMIHID